MVSTAGKVLLPEIWAGFTVFPAKAGFKAVEVSIPHVAPLGDCSPSHLGFFFLLSAGQNWVHVPFLSLSLLQNKALCSCVTPLLLSCLFLQLHFVSSGPPAALFSPPNMKTIIRHREKSHSKRSRKDWAFLLWKGKKRMSEGNKHKAMPGVERVRESPSVLRHSMMQWDTDWYYS